MTNSARTAPMLLDTERARLLVAAGGIVAATLKAQAGGWTVQLQTGKGGTVTLGTTKGGRVRTWRDLARAAAYVRQELGIVAAQLEMADWLPKQRVI
ncbi:MAG: hypothetical protein RPU34_06075 [Candidatus Sedimenticola sp. (ex Thyasira tokunagai)]